MPTSREIESTAATWLARRDGDAWTARDDAALDAWLRASTAHRTAFLRLDAAWRESDRLKALAAGRVAGGVPPRESGWRAGLDALAPTADGHDARDEDDAIAVPAPSRVMHPPAPRPRRRRLAALAIAASLAITAIGIAFAWWSQRDAVLERAAYVTPIGTLRTVALSDGSQATLSSNSDLALTWTRRTRGLDLARGEAFFSVAKDASRPFVVQAGDHRVVAVGTRFAVRHDGAALRVVVTEGTVRLEADASPGGKPTTLLPAGSIATVDAAGVLVRSVAIADAERALNWSRGFLTFRNTPLATAAAEFNRYNARPIVIDDDAVGALRIGGNFRWSNTDAFVRLVEQAFPVKAERLDDRIVIRAR